jgi:hypothetical protein
VAASEIDFLTTNPHAPNVSLKHTYLTAGQYCLSASMWGNHKYHGNGSCSYDCTVSQAVTVVVRDVPPSPINESLLDGGSQQERPESRDLL